MSFLILAPQQILAAYKLAGKKPWNVFGWRPSITFPALSIVRLSAKADGLGGAFSGSIEGWLELV